MQARDLNLQSNTPKEGSRMKYRNLLLCVVMASFLAVDGQSVPPTPARTPTQQNFTPRSKRMTPEMVMKRVGGFLMPPYNGNYCYVVNAQSRVGEDTFDWVLGQLHQVLGLPFRKERK